MEIILSLEMFGHVEYVSLTVLLEVGGEKGKVSDKIPLHSGCGYLLSEDGTGSHQVPWNLPPLVWMDRWLVFSDIMDAKKHRPGVVYQILLVMF